MIRRTFQHLPGVGPWREKDLWARGVLCWDDFPAEGVVLSKELDVRARAKIAESKAVLLSRDLQALARMVPPREHWRLFEEFESEAVFLDVEAKSAQSREITVVSLCSKVAGLQVFVRGRNLTDLPLALSSFPLWVSFNGSCFDEPVLRQSFPDLRPPDAHIDLRFVGRRVGFHGGLKEIEAQAGLSRPPHLEGLNGRSAVLLWQAYEERADAEALRRLVEYNLYDAISLRSLMDVVWNRALGEGNFDDRPRQVFQLGEVLYDVSQILLGL